MTDPNPKATKATIVKKLLGDKAIARLAKRPAARGKRYVQWDSSVPGFGIRVSDRGHLTYIFAARFPGSKNFTRREIAAVDKLDLAKARSKAREWSELVQNGIDPRAEEERERREQERKLAHTFKSVAEDYIIDRVIGPNPARPIQRKARSVERIIRNTFIKAWGNRPVASIDREDVLTIVRIKKRTAPAEARTQLGIIRSLFGWALNQSYGLDRSPCSDIRPAQIIGEATVRDRALSDDEVRALWTVANQTDYPTGPIYKMLLLSGLRLNEVVRARRSEFNLAKTEWIIPAARMKGRNFGAEGKKAKEHLVPLTAQMMEILETLPRFKHGDLLFSTTFGRKPFWLGDKNKKAIDAKMLEQLRQIAKERGNDPKEAVLPEWINHDLRRVVRSNLSKLKVAEEVSEAILAHAKVGMVGVYNTYRYADEKREALEAWAARLREIVSPPEPEPIKGDNVVRLRKA
jgi:integrase